MNLIGSSSIYFDKRAVMEVNLSRLILLYILITSNCSQFTNWQIIKTVDFNVHPLPTGLPVWLQLVVCWQMSMYEAGKICGLGLLSLLCNELTDSCGYNVYIVLMKVVCKIHILNLLSNLTVHGFLKKCVSLLTNPL